VAKYRFKLSPREIDKAIQIVRDHAADFGAKQDEFLRRLAERGAEIAREELQNMVYSKKNENQTLQLLNSITWGYDPEQKRGWVGTDLFYARFVEFGTGPRGSRDRHPEATDEWQYRQTPWVYYNDRVGHFLFTYGMPSRPFMYNTARRMESEAVRIAREVFGS